MSGAGSAYEAITEADIDTIADMDELRNIAKYFLRRDREENEQIEQRIGSLEQRLDQRDEQIGTLQAALHELKSFREAQPAEVLTPKKRTTAKRATPGSAGSAEDLHVGARCKIKPSGKQGVVRFVGRVSVLPAGVWVGVELDDGKLQIQFMVASDP